MASRIDLLLRMGRNLRTPIMVCLGLLFLSPVHAQVVKKDWTIGPELSNSGYGIHYTANPLPNSNLPLLINASLTTLRHAKEKHIYNPYYQNPRSYVFGKINEAAAARINLGFCHMLSGDPLHSTLRIALNAGPSFALVKPYYVYVRNLDNGDFNPEKKQQDVNDPKIMENILGEAGWAEGLNKTQIQAGINVDIALVADWNRSHRKQRLKTGLRLDYFPSDLHILQNNNNRLFTTYYLSYQIGSTGL